MVCLNNLHDLPLSETLTDLQVRARNLNSLHRDGKKMELTENLAIMLVDIHEALARVKRL